MSNKKSMEKKLVYLGLFIALSAGVFQLYLEYHKRARKRPLIYIDNYCGSDVEITKSGAVWLKILDNESRNIDDLPVGSNTLYAKRLDTGEVDTLVIAIQDERKYVINLFGGMRYYIGEVIYSNRVGELSEELPNGKVTAERVITTNADYIFVKPPARVTAYTFDEHPDYAEQRVKKVFIRRLIEGLNSEQKAVSEAIEEGKNNYSQEDTETEGIDNSISTTEEGPDDVIKASLVLTTNEILDKLRQGQTREAIVISSRLSLNQSSSDLLERYDELQKKYRMGLISFENWLVEQNRLDRALYNALSHKQAIRKEVDDTRISDLLESEEINVALSELIESGYTEMVLISGTLVKAKKEFNKGVINKEVYQTIIARKKGAILHALN